MCPYRASRSQQAARAASDGRCASQPSEPRWPEARPLPWRRPRSQPRARQRRGPRSRWPSRPRQRAVVAWRGPSEERRRGRWSSRRRLPSPVATSESPRARTSGVRPGCGRSAGATLPTVLTHNQRFANTMCMAPKDMYYLATVPVTTQTAPASGNTRNLKWSP